MQITVTVQCVDDCTIKTARSARQHNQIQCPHLQCRGLKKGRAIPLRTLRALVAYKWRTFTFTFLPLYGISSTSFPIHLTTDVINSETLTVSHSKPYGVLNKWAAILRKTCLEAVAVRNTTQRPEGRTKHTKPPCRNGDKLQYVISVTSDVIPSVVAGSEKFRHPWSSPLSNFMPTFFSPRILSHARRKPLN